MDQYIDGFVFPIAKMHLETYKQAAEKIANIWKEYGAISYHEFLGDEMAMEGTRSFIDMVKPNDDELVIFGWVVFESKEASAIAHAKVSTDPRMQTLVEPLMQPGKLIFDAERMFYGKFSSFIG